MSFVRSKQRKVMLLETNQHLGAVTLAFLPQDACVRASFFFWPLSLDCASQGVQCLAYGPLGGPNAYVPNDLLPHPVVSRIAQECGKSNGQVCNHRQNEILPRAIRRLGMFHMHVNTDSPITERWH